MEIYPRKIQDIAMNNSTPSHTISYGATKSMSAFHSIESLMTSSGQSSATGQENRMGVASAGHYQSMSSNYNMRQAYPSSPWPTTWASAYQTAPRQPLEPSHVSPEYYGARRSQSSEYRPNQYHSQPPVSDLSLNPFQYESQTAYQTSCQQPAQDFRSVEPKSTAESSNNDDILDVESYSPFSCSTNSPAASDAIQKTEPGPCSSSSAGYSSGYQSCDGSADSPTYRSTSSFPLGNTSCASPAFASFPESSPNMTTFRKPASPQGTFTPSASSALPSFPTQTRASKVTPQHASFGSSCRAPANVNAASLEEIPHSASLHLGQEQTLTSCNGAKTYSQAPHNSASYQEHGCGSYPESLHGQAPYAGRIHATPSYLERAVHASYPDEGTVAASYPDSSRTGAAFQETTPAVAPCMMAPQRTTAPSYQAQTLPAAQSSLPVGQDDAPVAEPAPTKKPRMKYTPAQLQTLEAFFVETPYPDWDELEELSKKLDIAEQKIKVWFQNKRARWRKKNAAKEKAEVPAPRPAQPTPLYGLPHAYPSMYPAAHERPAPYYNRPMYNVW